MQSLTHKNAEYLSSNERLISVPGLLFVLLIHAIVLYILWNQKLLPKPDQVVTLFAEFISAPPPSSEPPMPKAEPAPVKLQPLKKPVVKPKQERLVTKSTSPVKPTHLEPSKPDESIVEKAQESLPVTNTALPPQMPAAPITLSSELSVSCPKLSAPAYPAISRRMGEEGKLVLRVELDENGHIDNAKVINSSGYERLDSAALTAVKSWQCNPSIRNGQPVRAVALQPFNFVLQGN